MARRRNRSISGPIIFGSVAVVLTTGLLVGWILIILQNLEVTRAAVGNLWLLVTGIVSFVTIITVLVLFSISIARQVVEIRRQTTFVDSVTHELRSPLASIRLCLETLGRHGVEEQQREKLREMMLGDVERLSAFIDDILEANRIEHGRETHSVGSVGLRQLLERCARTVAKRHKVSADDIDIDIDEDLELHTDPVAIEIVFKNLLDNAVKYSDRPIDVRVVANVKATRVEIDVIDKGVGIPRGLLKRVFDRFYRVDAEAVRARRGTGLGLFVVRALVKSVGGRLRADSEGPGTGTTMRVELPLPTKSQTEAVLALPGEA